MPIKLVVRTTHCVLFLMFLSVQLQASTLKQFLNKVGKLQYSQEFTANGTWIQPAGVNVVTAECWGGGGGTASSCSTTGGAGSSGGNGYCKVVWWE